MPISTDCPPLAGAARLPRFGSRPAWGGMGFTTYGADRAGAHGEGPATGLSRTLAHSPSGGIAGTSRFSFARSWSSK